MPHSNDRQEELDRIYEEERMKRFHQLFRERSKHLISTEEEAEYQELLAWREERLKKPGQTSGS